MGTAFSRLASNFSMQSFHALGDAALQHLLSEATQLTNTCAARLAAEEEDSFFTEAFDNFVEGWVFFALAEPVGEEGVMCGMCGEGV